MLAIGTPEMKRMLLEAKENECKMDENDARAREDCLHRRRRYGK